MPKSFYGIYFGNIDRIQQAIDKRNQIYQRCIENCNTRYNNLLEKVESGELTKRDVGLVYKRCKVLCRVNKYRTDLKIIRYIKGYLRHLNRLTPEKLNKINLLNRKLNERIDKLRSWNRQIGKLL